MYWGFFKGTLWFLCVWQLTRLHWSQKRTRVLIFRCLLLSFICWPKTTSREGGLDLINIPLDTDSYSHLTIAFLSKCDKTFSFLISSLIFIILRCCQSRKVKFYWPVSLTPMSLTHHLLLCWRRRWWHLMNNKNSWLWLYFSIVFDLLK